MAAAGRAPHVLYVAWTYPPSRGGGVYRALATANAFAEAGWRVTVLTATRDTFERFTGTDTSLEAQIDPRIDVVRIPFAWPAMETDIRQWNALRALAPRVWRKLRVRQDVKDFPEPGYGPWATPLAEAAKAIHTQDPVDLTVATANPNVDFAAPDALWTAYGVPYVMDYRDAWMLHMFDGHLVHPEGSRQDVLERRLLKDAHEVWFVNAPIRDWHAERHPATADRMHVVANGYDPEFAPAPHLAPADPGKPLRVGYIGTLTPYTPLAAFLEAWRHARAASADLTKASLEFWGYLGFYSVPNPDLAASIAQYADDGASYRGPVAKTQVKDLYSTFDIVALVLGKGKYVTSGKVFEYAASALPIISVHDPGNATSDVLRDYPLWFPTPDLEPASIQKAVEAAAHAARTATPDTREACRDFAAQFSRDRQLAPRIAALTDAMALSLTGGDSDS